MEYEIRKNCETIYTFKSFEAAQAQLKEIFAIDCAEAEEAGDFLADRNGIKIEDKDGNQYTQWEICHLDSWDGGDYVFYDDFCEYTTADRDRYEILKGQKNEVRENKTTTTI